MRATSPLLAAILVSGLATSAGADPRTLVGGSFPEGPAVIGGVLHFVEYGSGKVVRLQGEASVLWEDATCGPSAVFPFQADLIVTCYDSGAIARINAKGETVDMVTADRDGRPFLGPNDFTSDGRGGVFFTTSGPWETAPIVGKVYHMPMEGGARMVADDLHYANGVALSPDGTRLYVAESEAGRIISFAIGADGSLSDRRLFVRLHDIDPDSGANPYPDGMEFGPGGNLYIGQYSSGRIVVVTPDATLKTVIEVPSPAAPNLAFKPDGSGIYVTAVDQTDAAPYAGTVYEIDLK